MRGRGWEDLVPRKSANGFDELEDSDVETVRQPHDIEQANVSFAALDAADVIAMQVR